MIITKDLRTKTKYLKFEEIELQIPFKIMGHNEIFIKCKENFKGVNITRIFCINTPTIVRANDFKDGNEKPYPLEMVNIEINIID